MQNYNEDKKMRIERDLAQVKLIAFNPRHF